MITLEECNKLVENLILLTETKGIVWESETLTGSNNCVYTVKNEGDLLICYYYGTYNNALFVSLQDRNLNWYILRNDIGNATKKVMHKINESTLILQEELFPRLNYLNFLLMNYSFSKKDQLDNFLQEKLLQAKCLENTSTTIKESNIL